MLHMAGCRLIPCSSMCRAATRRKVDITPAELTQLIAALPMGVSADNRTALTKLQSQLQRLLRSQPQGTAKERKADVLALSVTQEGTREHGSTKSARKRKHSTSSQLTPSSSGAAGRNSASPSPELDHVSKRSKPSEPPQQPSNQQQLPPRPSSTARPRKLLTERTALAGKAPGGLPAAQQHASAKHNALPTADGMLIDGGHDIIAMSAAAEQIARERAQKQEREAQQQQEEQQQQQPEAEQVHVKKEADKAKAASPAKKRLSVRSTASTQPSPTAGSAQAAPSAAAAAAGPAAGGERGSSPDEVELVAEHPGAQPLARPAAKAAPQAAAEQPGAASPRVPQGGPLSPAVGTSPSTAAGSTEPEDDSAPLAPLPEQLDMVVVTSLAEQYYTQQIRLDHASRWRLRNYILSGNVGVSGRSRHLLLCACMHACTCTQQHTFQ
jgi:hypothetical protein